MIICSCNALSHRDVVEAVRRGADRPQAVYGFNECRAQCGNCVPSVVCVLRAMLKDQCASNTQGANGPCRSEAFQNGSYPGGDPQTAVAAAAS